MKPKNPANQDLLLIGGGHAHVQLVKMFAMQPEPGLRLTLVSDVYFAPYSGMLPGFLAGIYTWHEVHFDLARICAKAGARFVSGKAVSIDAAAKQVRLDNGATLAYDVLSVNVGSVPTLPADIDREHTLAVKPISQFLRKWQTLLDGIAARANITENQAESGQYAVVGGGAAGFEVALILQRKLREVQPKAQVRLFQADDRLLAAQPPRLSKLLQDKALAAGLALHLGQRIASFRDGLITSSDGLTYPCDQSIWATQAAAPPLFGASALPTDERGFLKVRRTLQAEGHDQIFGAGDCIAFPVPLPKSGVFAVREAKTLAANIRRLLKKKTLRVYQPQKKQLSLITAGEKSAYASRGFYLGSGSFWWHVKDHIDRKFMQRWQDYPFAMADLDNEISNLTHPVNTCGGCGSKVGPATLRNVLGRTLRSQQDGLLVRVDTRDDAVVTNPLHGERIVESVDFFRAFFSDPFLTGKVAALHALSDLYAMGAKPFSAQILLQLPDLPAGMVERDLQLVLEGALSALQPDGAVLSGGHTTVGPELQVGFAVLGTLTTHQPVLNKTGAMPDDVLILTKPLGTGACLKAHMAGALRGDHLEEITRGMCQSNRIMLTLAAQLPIHAATDVTGFGLAGHLLEMFPGSDPGRMIDQSAVPVYSGFAAACMDGYETPLAREIREHATLLAGAQANDWPAAWFDPQTSGGLIFCTPTTHAAHALAILKHEGFQAATVIGRIP